MDTTPRPLTVGELIEKLTELPDWLPVEILIDQPIDAARIDPLDGQLLEDVVAPVIAARNTGDAIELAIDYRQAG